MDKVIYVSDFLNQQDLLIDAICSDGFDFGTIFTNQRSFIDFISATCSDFNLPESFVDIFRKVVLNNYRMNHLPISTINITYLIIDYMYSKYSDTALADCRLLNLLYMYDIKMFISDQNYFDIIGLNIGIPKLTIDRISDLNFIRSIVDDTSILLQFLDINYDLYILNMVAGIDQKRWKVYKKEINDS